MCEWRERDVTRKERENKRDVKRKDVCMNEVVCCVLEIV